jgi:hypothetical protein
MRVSDWTIGTTNPPHYAAKRIPEGSRQEEKAGRGTNAASARRMNRQDSERNQGGKIIQTFALP